MSPRYYVSLKIVYVVLFGLSAGGCSRSPETPPADPRLGRECFELHRAALPPGSQYEGAETTNAGIVVKVMDGVDLVSLECILGPDGRLNTR